MVEVMGSGFAGILRILREKTGGREKRDALANRAPLDTFGACHFFPAMAAHAAPKSSSGSAKSKPSSHGGGGGGGNVGLLMTCVCGAVLGLLVANPLLGLAAVGVGAAVAASR